MYLTQIIISYRRNVHSDKGNKDNNGAIFGAWMGIDD